MYTRTSKASDEKLLAIKCKHVRKTVATAAMSSPNESRTGQLQVKHKRPHMYKNRRKHEVVFGSIRGTLRVGIRKRCSV